MKVLRLVLMPALLLFISCAGPIKIEKDGTMHGATYDVAMVEIIARANLLRAYAQNPAAFDYKCPFDQTDIRKTNRRISEARKYYNQLNSRQKSDFDRRVEEQKEKMRRAREKARREKVEREKKEGSFNQRVEEQKEKMRRAREKAQREKGGD